MAAVARVDRSDLLDHAKEIASEYRGNLTLRQLYYQLVARGYSPNSQRDYKRIGEVVATARLAGAFPFDWLLDRTRECHPGAYTERLASVRNALEESAAAIGNFPHWYLRADRWWGQPRHVSVWVEKEALAGVFERPCTNLGVSWFTCKGYPSLSALYQWVKQVEEVVEASRLYPWTEGDSSWDDEGSGLDEVVILYFGDHDPDGWQIPRSAFRTVTEIAQVEGIELPPLTMRRVALNIDQIRAFNPPPFPAKMTSSRYEGYVREHGTTDAWELDALRPEQLQQLIRDNVSALFDQDRYEEIQQEITDLRTEFRGRLPEILNRQD